MQWSLLGLWAMSLYALAQATKRGVEPRRLSAAQLLLAFRRMLRDYRHPVERGHSLCGLLGDAVIDPYTRQNKSSRNYPRKNASLHPARRKSSPLPTSNDYARRCFDTKFEKG